MRAARRAFAASVAAYAVALAVAAWTLPARVPLHFGVSGEVDRWATRPEAVLTMAGIGLAVAALLGGTAAGASRLPTSLINVPDKDWWIARPDRERRLRQLMRTDLWVIGAATMLLLTVIVVLTAVVAHRPEPALGWWGWLVLVPYLAVVLGYAIYAARVRYRPPTDAPTR